MSPTYGHNSSKHLATIHTAKLTAPSSSKGPQSSLTRRLSASPTTLRAPANLNSKTRSSLDSTFSNSTTASSYVPINTTTTTNALAIDNSRDDIFRTTSTNSTTPPSTLRRHLTNFYISNYGALLVLFSQFFGSLMNLFTTLLEHSPLPHPNGGMHPFQILFVRQSITALLCTIYAVTTKSIPDFPLGPRNIRIRLLLLTRGVTGFFGVFGMYYSLLYLPLAEATVLTFLAPILTCYLCSLLLPDGSSTFGRQQQLAALVSLVGVIFIARPASLFSSSTPPPTHTSPSTGGPDTSASPVPSPTSSQRALSIALSLLGVLGATGAMTTIRAIGQRAHPFLSINYFSTWCSLVSLIALVIIPGVDFRLPKDLREWGLLIGLGTAGWVMQWLLTAGLSYGGQETKPETNMGVNGRSRPGPATDPAGDDAVASLDHGEDDYPNRSELRKIRSREEKLKGSGTRATSMVYTQMLFALTMDKLVFGVSPSALSWVGSALIVAGAVWVAVSSSTTEKKVQDGGAIELGVRRRSRGKAEEQVGLMSGGNGEEEEDEDDGIANRPDESRPEGRGWRGRLQEPHDNRAGQTPSAASGAMVRQDRFAE